MLRERLRVPRHVGLRLASGVRWIGGTGDRLLPVVSVVGATLARRRCFVLRGGEVGIVLAELLLRRGYDAVIVLGVLIVVLRRNRITGSLRVPRKLNIFFCNVGWIAANFHIRTIGFVYPHHRIVTLAVIVASAHAFILTVSHDLPIANPLHCGGSLPPCLPPTPPLPARGAPMFAPPPPYPRRTNSTHPPHL